LVSELTLHILHARYVLSPAYTFRALFSLAPYLQLEAEARLTQLKKKQTEAEAALLAEADARRAEIVRRGDELVHQAAAASDRRVAEVKQGVQSQMSRLHSLEDELLKGQAAAQAESARLASAVQDMRARFARLEQELTAQEQEAVRQVVAEGLASLENARSRILKELAELQVSHGSRPISLSAQLLCCDSFLPAGVL
jgi:hypothetical protein